ncbi:MAG: hypothetical protein EKK64_02980 [Neisseriaceae bacterium]|nr:MAG: hypothetical protein EKK64_02980 [Neisseriaceae bacterium]
MPYFDSYNTGGTPVPDEIGFGINYRRPSTLQDIIKTNGYDDLSIWRNHLDLFEVSYIVCFHSDGTVKLETDYYTANFDASNNYKFIGIE